jgi:hypothetical protein
MDGLVGFVNRKAYAAWWLWAVLGGWNETQIPHFINTTPWIQLLLFGD